ncbi:hypothetical protein Pyn_16693 [Prunus yedoensis var. nudiflora]|uniref:Uncharacterized protein n=1 Tax=Prunus yedoensis var. nudiflora TaxID=2094558 RepID=A0A314Y2V2_PRUYE|nr:hypothetical protein Pyn_16693 [Prunus yedoensis var. nudiflora]
MIELKNLQKIGNREEVKRLTLSLNQSHPHHHDPGKVKQIVGSTLSDSKESGSALVDLSRAAAIEALHAYAGGSMVAFLFL